MTNPAPELVKQTRINTGLTQTKAAELIGAKLRTWQDWESGQRNMPDAKWELFLIKINKDT